MSLDGTLESHNLSAREAWNFINVTLDRPDLIFAEAARAGFSVDMLTELVGRYDAGIGRDDVTDFFTRAGLDASALEPQPSATPTPVGPVYAGEYHESSGYDLPTAWDDAPTAVFTQGDGPIIVHGTVDDDHDPLDTLNVVTDAASWAWLVLDEPTAPKIAFDATMRYKADDSRAYELRSVEHMGDSQQRAIPLGTDAANKYATLDINTVYDTGAPQAYTLIVGSMADIRETVDMLLG
jgi:hypothetical protein